MTVGAMGRRPVFPHAESGRPAAAPRNDADSLKQMAVQWEPLSYGSNPMRMNFPEDDSFIDIHVHTMRTPGFPRPCDRQTYASPAQLLAGYDEVGVERAAVLPECNPECSTTLQSVEEVLQIAADSGGRFVPFCNADPRAIGNSPFSPLGDLLKYYRDLGCRGVGEVCANLSILDPMVQNLFKGAQEAGLPLTFHLTPYIGCSYGLVDEAGLPGLELVLQRFPNLRIFGHSQTFWAEISVIRSVADRLGYPAGTVEEGAIPRLMRKYPNLYGDLSAGSGCNALTRDRAYASKFLTEFQDRLFFGTDICQPTMPTLRPLAKFLRELRDSGEITQTVFRKVARENAIRELAL